jgi:tRNA pseudouridine38-40 synthase
MVRQQLIAYDNFGYPNKYSWSTSGRTDKGVHAAAQTISLKIECAPEQIDHLRTAVLPLLNTTLPSDIQILDICRTTRGFMAKPQRDRVRYQYMIPSFCFYERNELRTILNKSVTAPPPPQPVDVVSQLSPTLCSTTDPTNTVESTGSANTTTPVVPWRIPTSELYHVQDQIGHFRSTTEQRQKLQSTLRQYIGTHSFHNFTRRCTAQEARSKRYIMDFQVGDPVILSTPRYLVHPNNSNNNNTHNNSATGGENMKDMIDMEWIPTTVTGQSFLLNQIRKMIWLAVEITRDAVPASTLSAALKVPPPPPRKSNHKKEDDDDDIDSNNQNHPSIRIGLAPAQGLYLDMSFYEVYNTKIRRSDNTTSAPLLDWFVPNSAANVRWKTFRDTVIVPHVAAEEIAQGNFLQYMYMLENPTYFQLRQSNEDDDDDNEEEDGDYEDDGSNDE